MAVNNKKINNSDNLEQENFILEEVENDLKKIKGLENIKREDFKKPEVFKDLSELSSFFINNPNLLDFLQKNIVQEEEFRVANFIPSDKDIPENLKELKNIISNLENKLGLDKQDILAVYRSYDEKISLEAKSEVLKSKKTIKIGNKEFPVATLIRIPAYLAGTAAVSLTTAGIAGVAGVALFRNLEKYISDKRDKKNIEIKAKEIRKKLDKKQLTSVISSSLFIRKLEKEEKVSSENFLIKKTEEERNKIISDFVEIKYSQVDSKIKDKIIRKYKYQFEIEKSQIKKEKDSNFKPSGAMEKIYNFLTKDSSSSVSVESKTIRSIIISGAIITTGKIAREVPVVKNILGAYLGWNLGGLADNIINKKEIVSSFDEQNFVDELISVKASYEEYKKNASKIGDGNNRYIELFDELLEDLKRLENSRVKALLELEKNSLKDINPERYLFIKQNIDEASKYIHLIKARFNSIDLNKKKEDFLLQNKKSQEASKLKSSLFKAGGLMLGALTPSIVSLITENVHSAPVVEAQVDVKTDSFFSDIKSPDFFQYTENNGGEIVDIDNSDFSKLDNEISLEDNNVNIESKISESNIENNINLNEFRDFHADKINEIIGTTQKSIIIEGGDGVSKIFDGNMSSSYKVNFIDEQTGEVFESAAGSKIIHPGDEVILGEDGNVSVICKQGVFDNPKYVDNYLSEENIVPEKMVTLKPEEIKISSEISSNNNLSEISSEMTSPEELVDSNIFNNNEEGAIFEKPEYEITRSSDGKLTIEKITDNDVSDSNIIEGQNISEGTEIVTLDNSGNVESISDPNALRLDYDENGRIVLKDSGGNIIKGSSSEEVINKNGNNFEGTENNSFEDRQASELDENLTEISSEDFGNVNESFKTPESFKEILGEGFSNLKIIEKVDNLGNRLGFSLKDVETGKSVDISFPRTGGIRMEEGLNDQAFGKLQENFDEVEVEDRALIIGLSNDGSFSVEDFRSGIKKILE